MKKLSMLKFLSVIIVLILTACSSKQSIAPNIILVMTDDQWWSEVRPFMVNETVALAKEKPFWVDFEKQKKSKGIQRLSTYGEN